MYQHYNNYADIMAQTQPRMGAGLKYSMHSLRDRFLALQEQIGNTAHDWNHYIFKKRVDARDFICACGSVVKRQYSDKYIFVKEYDDEATLSFGSCCIADEERPEWLETMEAVFGPKNTWRNTYDVGEQEVRSGSCVCTMSTTTRHAIRHRHREEIHDVGSCCVRHFKDVIGASSLRCHLCELPHQNRGNADACKDLIMRREAKLECLKRKFAANMRQSEVDASSALSSQ